MGNQVNMMYGILSLDYVTKENLAMSTFKHFGILTFAATSLCLFAASSAHADIRRLTSNEMNAITGRAGLGWKCNTPTDASTDSCSNTRAGGSIKYIYYTYWTCGSGIWTGCSNSVSVIDTEMDYYDAPCGSSNGSRTSTAYTHVTACDGTQ